MLSAKTLYEYDLEYATAELDVLLSRDADFCPPAEQIVRRPAGGVWHERYRAFA